MRFVGLGAGALLFLACGAGVRRNPLGRPGGDAGIPTDPGDTGVATDEGKGAGGQGDAVADGGAEPDGGAAQDGSVDGLRGYWLKCGQLGSGGPTALALSAAADVLAVAFDNGEVIVYRMADRAEIGRIATGLRPAPTIALSPDGSQLAASTSTVGLWRVADGQRLWLTTKPAGYPTGAPVFSADGAQLLAVLGEPQQSLDDYAVRRLRPADGAIERTYQPGQAYSFTPDGRVAILRQRVLTSYGASATGQSRAVPIDRMAVFSPRGDLLAGTHNGMDAPIELYRVDDGKRLWVGQNVPAGTHLRFSSDQRVLSAFDLSNPEVLTLDPLEGMSRQTTLGSTLKWALLVRDLEFVSDGAIALIASPSGLFRVSSDSIALHFDHWETHMGQGHPIRSIAVSGDGRWLATGSMGAAWSAQVWELGAPGQLQRTIPTRLPSSSVTFSPDGTKVLRANGNVEEWPLDGGEADTPAWTYSRKDAWTARYSPDGARVAVSLTLPSVMVVRRSGAESAEMLPTPRPYPGIAFSPDGKLLATSGPELWRLADMSRLWPAPAPITMAPAEAENNWVDFSHRGLLVVNSEFIAPMATLGTSVLRTLDGSTLRDLALLPMRPAFSADDRWVISGGTARSLEQPNKAWDVGVSQGTSVFLPDGTIAVGLRSGVVQLHCPR
jgi:WD40 repeat protein